MLDSKQLDIILDRYKKSFPFRWNGEKYRWQAIKHFQANWNAEADDFADMLERALANTCTLLGFGNSVPVHTIVEFAKSDPGTVRSMFVSLFIDDADIYQRISAFKKASSRLNKKYGSERARHYQDERIISTYLWLRYPDSCYRYDFRDVKSFAERVAPDYSFAKSTGQASFFEFHNMYEDLRAELKRDAELRDMLGNKLTDSCYPDPELITLTMDVAFYIARYGSWQGTISSESEWTPSTYEYDPGLTVDDWLALLSDDRIFNTGCLEVMKRLKDSGGAASALQLAEKYGESKNFYITNSAVLAKRVVKATGCPVMRKWEGEPRWWTVLYLGKEASVNGRTIFAWRLRDELYKALDQVDLSKIALYSADNAGRYWWINEGTSASDLLYTTDGVLEGIQCTMEKPVSLDTGDMVIVCRADPCRQIVSTGTIAADDDTGTIHISNAKVLAAPISLTSLAEYDELQAVEALTAPQGSMYRLTEAEYDFIMGLIERSEQRRDTYSREDFLDEVFMPGSMYDHLAAVLRNKKNVILHGAPGVGKTFAAKRLAYSMMGEKDDSRIEFVQFHQNYTYEDFVMGYKPAGDGFELKHGVFYRFCQLAAEQPDKEFFFLIDEINRGNLSKIFGELLMLIERDYRGSSVALAYDGLKFSVPENLYILGMMNTADRSLAMIDYALRRRFSFFGMEPGFDSDGFIHRQKELDSEPLNKLVSMIKRLNKEIEADRTLGKGFCVGHSYFCGPDKCTHEWLYSIVEYDIIPMLEEYWFDEPDKLQNWQSKLRSVLQ